MIRCNSVQLALVPCNLAESTRLELVHVSHQARVLKPLFELSLGIRFLFLVLLLLFCHTIENLPFLHRIKHIYLHLTRQMYQIFIFVHRTDCPFWQQSDDMVLYFLSLLLHCI